MSSNVVVARHTVSCLLQCVWTGVHRNGSIGGMILWTRVQSREKPFLACVLISVSIPLGLPSIISHRLSKPTSCAATKASPRGPSQTLDIASTHWSPDLPVTRSRVRNSPRLESCTPCARRLRGIYFIDPEYEEFKDIMKHARGKLEIPMPAAMPCKTSLCRSCWETFRTIGGHKTKFACIVEADESMRIRMEGAPHRYHEDHSAGKDMNSLSHYHLVRKFIPMLQAMNIPDAKAAVERRKNGKNSRKYRHGS